MTVEVVKHNLNGKCSWCSPGWQHTILRSRDRKELKAQLDTLIAEAHKAKKGALWSEPSREEVALGYFYDYVVPVGLDRTKFWRAGVAWPK